MDNQQFVSSQPSQTIAPPEQPITKYPKSKRLLMAAISLVILIAAVIGTYFWQHNKVNSLNTKVASLNSQVSKLNEEVTKQSNIATSSSKSGSTSTINSYTGWATYTTKNEKLSFKYPSSFTLTDDSTVANNDDVYLKASNNFEMDIHAGGGVQDVCPYGGCNIVKADSVTFNGQPAFLDIWSSQTTAGAPINKAYLSQSSTNYSDYFDTKNISGVVFISIGYNTNPVNSSQTNYVQEPLSTLLNDTNYADAKLVIESMHY